MSDADATTLLWPGPRPVWELGASAARPDVVVAAIRAATSGSAATTLTPWDIVLSLQREAMQAATGRRLDLLFTVFDLLPHAANSLRVRATEVGGTTAEAALAAARELETSWERHRRLRPHLLGATASDLEIDALMARRTVAGLEDEWRSALASTVLAFVSADRERLVGLSQRLRAVVSGLRAAVLHDALDGRHGPARHVLDIGAAILAAAADLTPEPVLLGLVDSIQELGGMPLACEAAARWADRVRNPVDGNGATDLNGAGTVSSAQAELTARVAAAAWQVLERLSTADARETDAALTDFAGVRRQAIGRCLRPGDPAFLASFDEAAAIVTDSDLEGCASLLPIPVRERFLEELATWDDNRSAVGRLTDAGRPLEWFRQAAWRRTAPADAVIGWGILLGDASASADVVIERIDEIVAGVAVRGSTEALRAVERALSVATECAEAVASLCADEAEGEPLYRMGEVSVAFDAVLRSIDAIPPGQLFGDATRRLRTIAANCVAHPSILRSVPAGQWPALAAVAALGDQTEAPALMLLRGMVAHAVTTLDPATLDAVGAAVDAQRSALFAHDDGRRRLPWIAGIESLEVVLRGVRDEANARDELIAGGIQAAAEVGLAAVPFAVAMAVVAERWTHADANAALGRLASVAVARRPVAEIAELALAAGRTALLLRQMQRAGLFRSVTEGWNAIGDLSLRLGEVVALGAGFDQARQQVRDPSGHVDVLDTIQWVTGHLARALEPEGDGRQLPTPRAEAMRQALIGHLAQLLCARPLDDAGVERLRYGLGQVRGAALAGAELLRMREAINPRSLLALRRSSEAYRRLGDAVTDILDTAPILRRIDEAIPCLTGEHALSIKPAQEWLSLIAAAAVAVAAGPATTQVFTQEHIVRMVQRLAGDVLFEDPPVRARLAAVAAAASTAGRRLDALGTLIAPKSDIDPAWLPLLSIQTHFTSLAHDLEKHRVDPRWAAEAHRLDGAVPSATSSRDHAGVLLSVVLELGRVRVAEAPNADRPSLGTLANLFSTVCNVSDVNGAARSVEPTMRPREGPGSEQAALRQAADTIEVGLTALRAVEDVLPAGVLPAGVLDPKKLRGMVESFDPYPSALRARAEIAPRLDELVAAAAPYLGGQKPDLASLAGRLRDIALGLCLPEAGHGPGDARAAVWLLIRGTGAHGVDPALLEEFSVAFHDAMLLAWETATLLPQSHRQEARLLSVTLAELSQGLGRRAHAAEFLSAGEELAGHLRSGKPLVAASPLRWQAMLSAAALGFDAERTDDYVVDDRTMLRLVNELADHATDLRAGHPDRPRAIRALVAAHDILRDMEGLAENQERTAVAALTNHVDVILESLLGDAWRYRGDEWSDNGGQDLGGSPVPNWPSPSGLSGGGVAPEVPGDVPPPDSRHDEGGQANTTGGADNYYRQRVARIGGGTVVGTGNRVPTPPPPPPPPSPSPVR